MTALRCPDGKGHISATVWPYEVVRQTKDMTIIFCMNGAILSPPFPLPYQVVSGASAKNRAIGVRTGSVGETSVPSGASKSLPA